MFKKIPLKNSLNSIWVYIVTVKGTYLLVQNEVHKPIRLLQFVAFVHLPFSFRSLNLFVASLLFMQGTSYYVVKRK